MAIRTLKNATSPELVKPLDGQHLVEHSGTEEDAAGLDRDRVYQNAKRALRTRDAADSRVPYLDVPIRLELLPGDLPKIVRGCPITGHEIVDVLRGGVPTRTGIAKENALTPPSERQRSSETRGASSYDHDVIRHSPHHTGARAPRPNPPRVVPRPTCPDRRGA